MLPYKNQEICNKTNLWKFQLISLFLLWKNIKNAFSIFVFILMAGVFRLARRKLLIGSYFTNYSKTITHQAEIFQGKLSTIVIFIPCKLCVNLWTFLFFGLTNVVQVPKNCYFWHDSFNCLYPSYKNCSFGPRNCTFQNLSAGEFWKVM